MEIILAIVLSYLIGSISPSIILGKILKGIDIRKHGSGNAGSSNVFRVLGKKAGITVMIIDIMKGFVAVRLAATYHSLFPSHISLITLSILCGVAAIIGHIRTIFHSFKGGKGVNTAAGVLLGLLAVETLIAVTVFLCVFLSTGFISLGSILASISLPIIIIIRKTIFHQMVPVELLIFSTIIPILIIATHRANIKRLLKGEENRFSVFGKK